MFHLSRYFTYTWTPAVKLRVHETTNEQMLAIKLTLHSNCKPWLRNIRLSDHLRVKRSTKHGY